MIKGLISLITTGVIFNPIAWVGIGSGLYMMLYRHMTINQVHEVFLKPEFYGAIFVVSAIYTLIFKRVHHAGAKGTDWKATFQGIIGRFVGIIFFVIVSCLGVVGYGIAGSEQTAQAVNDNRNVKILKGVAKSAVEAPTLPGEK